MENEQNQIQDPAKAPLTYQDFYDAMALVSTKEQFESLSKKMADEFEKVERRIGNIEANMMTKKDKEEMMAIFHKFLKKYTD